MTPRVGETHEQFNARRAATRPSRAKFEMHSFTKDGKGKVTSRRFVQAGRTDAEIVKVPDPSVVSKTSTLYGADGSVRAQWVLEKPEDRQRYETLMAWADQMAQDLPARPFIVPPVPKPLDGLLVAYPVGDHHLGMLAWKHETGESYDIDLAEEILTKAVSHLIVSAPQAGTALIPFLGDFFHYDSYDSVTPTHRNLLDSDGRAPKMVDAGMRLMETVIEMAAGRHNTVRIIVELGNHDRYTSMIAARWLNRIYRDNPRISVDISPSHFHYYEFGSNLLGTTHGDARVAKPAQLPGIMAHDQREAWGRTNYHYWMTGHVHHEAVREYPGCRVESFRILAPADAYAHNEGYRSGRDMKAIVIHKDYGEVGRHIVNPDMLRSD